MFLHERFGVFKGLSCTAIYPIGLVSVSNVATGVSCTVYIEMYGYWFCEATSGCWSSNSRGCLGLKLASESAVSCVVVTSFSQGFLRWGLVASVPWPSRTVDGISLIPGTGFPLVISSTMWANDVGYGAGGSFALAADGIIPPEASASMGGSSTSDSDVDNVPREVGGVGGGLLRASR